MRRKKERKREERNGWMVNIWPRVEWKDFSQKILYISKVMVFCSFLKYLKAESKNFVEGISVFLLKYPVDKTDFIRFHLVPQLWIQCKLSQRGNIQFSWQFLMCFRQICTCWLITTLSSYSLVRRPAYLVVLCLEGRPGNQVLGC